MSAWALGFNFPLCHALIPRSDSWRLLLIVFKMLFIGVSGLIGTYASHPCLLDVVVAWGKCLLIKLMHRGSHLIDTGLVRVKSGAADSSLWRASKLLVKSCPKVLNQLVSLDYIRPYKEYIACLRLRPIFSHGGGEASQPSLDCWGQCTPAVSCGDLRKDQGRMCGC